MPIINMQQLARIVKQSYKHEIIIGYAMAGIVIHNGMLTVWFDDTTAPKKLKAIIAEAIGKIPAPGSGLSSYSEFHENEPYVCEMETVDRICGILLDKMEADVALKETPVRLGAHVLLQEPETSKTISLDMTLAALLDKTKIDYNIEGDPTGPACSYTSPIVYWSTQTCTLAIHPSTLSEHPLEIARYLETLKLYKED